MKRRIKVIFLSCLLTAQGLQAGVLRDLSSEEGMQERQSMLVPVFNGIKSLVASQKNDTERLKEEIEALGEDFESFKMSINGTELISFKASVEDTLELFKNETKAFQEETIQKVIELNEDVKASATGSIEEMKGGLYSFEESVRRNISDFELWLTGLSFRQTAVLEHINDTVTSLSSKVDAQALDLAELQEKGQGGSRGPLGTSSSFFFSVSLAASLVSVVSAFAVFFMGKKSGVFRKQSGEPLGLMNRRSTADSV